MNRLLSASGNKLMVWLRRSGNDSEILIALEKMEGASRIHTIRITMDFHD